MHLNGLSVVRDNGEAFKLYSLAAEQGSAEGEVRRGRLAAGQASAEAQQVGAAQLVELGCTPLDIGLLSP